MTKKTEKPPEQQPELVSIDMLNDDAADVIPAGTPLFDFDPEKVAARKARGVDVTPAFWQVEKWIDGKRKTIDKTFPAQSANAAFLSRTLGEGSYLCTMKNAAGQVLGRKTHNIDGPANGHASAREILSGGDAGNGTFSGAPRSQTMMDKVLEVMLLRALDPPKAADDPMRDAMATIVKGMALQQQMAMQSLQMQMQVGDRQGQPGKENADRMFSLLEKLANGNGGAKNGNGNGGALGALAELMPILNLGMNLGQKMAGGGAAPAEKKNEWLEMIPELADSVGVPLIIAISQSLPAEKAREALRAIEEHMKARQKEADAEKANAPVNTTGEPVP